MPTPVTTARQCLTKEAEHALDEAVAVAHRRGQAQTTSLHMVSSLLSLPSSALREACSRTRNSAYSTRIQFKALELCLGVSLDRLPSSPSRVEEPPVSNSLMAAIKRSQANQRRQPENFNFYQQQQQQQLLSSSSSTISVVKVELQTLILSILDDPVVSKVFGDAGFRSCEIKIAILRPVHQLLRYSRYKAPSMFLSNLSADNELGRRGFSFPFMGYSGVLDGDENCRRIGEVMVRDDSTGRRNPLLIGECACDSLRSFLDMVQRRRGRSALPVELSGLGVICIENDILSYVCGNCEEELMKFKFEEVGGMVENCVGPGVVVNFGDLNALTGDDASVDALRFVVCELARLLEVHEGKLWLIGSAARHETYLKFLNIFPSIEKDWDLQLLPITTQRLSMGETYPRSSLMESFVPFGGFFSSPSDVKSTLSRSLSVSRCHLCNEKCDQEVNAVSNKGFSASVADHYRSNLPSWLQMTEFSTCGLDMVENQDDRVLLSTKIAGLHRKWDNICEQVHNSQQLPKASNYQLDSQVPSVVGFQVLEGRKSKVNSDSSGSHYTKVSLTETRCSTINSFVSGNGQKFATSKASSPTSFLSKASNVNFQSKFSETSSKVIEDHGVGSPFNSSSSSVGDGLTSPTSVTSLTVDLNLELNSACTNRGLEKPTNKNCMDLMQNFACCLSANPEVAIASISRNQDKSSSCSYPDINVQSDQKDFKGLYTALANRIGWQEEAIKVVSQTVARCRTTNERRHRSNCGDIWFNFLGPDRLGKKQVVKALAEILHGNSENLIHVDLSIQDKLSNSSAIFDLQLMNSNSVNYRGKNVVDYIAEKLSKKPLSVVFLESIDKADLLVQNSLSKAVKTGRFSDSHGRETGIGNAIFVTTSRFVDQKKTHYPETSDYSEEDILAGKGGPIQMIIGFDLCDDVTRLNSSMLDSTRKDSSNLIFMNKRKLIANSETVEQCSNLEIIKRAHRASDVDLDLNFPAEGGEVCNASPGNSETDFTSENSRAWLEDFLGQFDATVVFQPFDFDALAQKILQDISECFQKIVRSECSLEIDSRVMMQMVAAASLTNKKRVQDWVQRVLSKGFEEAQEKYSLTARSTVKLVPCNGICPTEQTPAEFLPSRIILN